jgi:AcrR family transcriptional regulator
METPARIIRAKADELKRPPAPSTREFERQEHIITTARGLMAEHGPHTLTIRNLAIGLRMSTFTLRCHFVDIDSLLHEIISRHLTALAKALGAVLWSDPDRRRKQREIYYNFTHSPFGGLTEDHLIFTRYRHLLPTDLRDSVETRRDNMAELVAGPFAIAALTLLDAPCITLPDIETMIAALPEPAPAKPAHKVLQEFPPKPHPMPGWDNPIIRPKTQNGEQQRWATQRAPPHSKRKKVVLS